MRGGPEEQRAGIGDERTEIGQGPDAEKNKRRKDLEFDALQNEVIEPAGDVVDAEAAGVERGALDGENTRFDESVGQHAAGDHALGRQIGQQGAEGDRDKQERLEFFVDAEIEQDGADDPHDSHLPRDGGERGQLEERGEVTEDVDEEVHRTLREA